jgi:hypothetical protein
MAIPQGVSITVKTGPNTREVRGQLDDGRSVTVLVSYSTPVAVIVEGGQVYHNNERGSRTTARHISQWIAGRKNGGTVPQAEIDSFLNDLTGFNRI